MLDEVLLDNFDVIHFLNSYGYKVKFIGGATKYLTRCAFCNKDAHMGVNPKTKKFGCFKCHSGGSIVNLISKILGKNYYETLEFLKKGVDPRHYSSTYLEKALEIVYNHQDFEAKIKPIALPEGYISLYNNRIPYLDKRRIPQDQVHYYKMGVCVTGKYRDRLIVCDVNDKQEPIYWVARDTTGLVPKNDKVWNAPNINGVGSADLLFNYFLAKDYPFGVITEGLFDSMWIGNNGLSTYGKGIKSNHLYWVIKGCFKKIILLYDPDVARDELEKSASLLGTFVETYICQLPEDDPRDPDEYDKSELWNYINTRSELYVPSLKIKEFIIK